MLDNPALTADIDSVARSVIERFGYADAELRLLQFEDNAVYRVDARGTTAVLRVSVTNSRSISQQSSEAWWLNELSRHPSIQAPKPIAADNGNFIIEVGSSDSAVPMLAAMFAWLPGVGSPNLTSTLVHNWGRATGVMHSIAKRVQVPSTFVRPRWTIETILHEGCAISRQENRGFLPSRTSDVLKELADRLAPPEVSSRDHGIIHADLHIGNVVSDDGHNVGIIDFDDFGTGPFILDIATALSSIARRSKPDEFKSLCDAFVRGYVGENQLPNAQDLRTFLILRDVIILNFIGASTRAEVGAWGPGRAREILDCILRFLGTGSYVGDAAGPALGLEAD